MISEIISSIDIFKSASDKELEALLNSTSIKTYAPNTIVLSLGDEPINVYFVISGLLQVYLDNDEGRQVVIRDLVERDCFGGIGCNM